ncbi:MAG: NlpC/P60 family protein, partial [Actinobacteria bacterium]|nr:NlpC/P60 family protein [Actinomycetota bacterium]
MRLIYALAISLALVVSTPGLATADTFNRPARNQQAINYVLTRALAQIGVPFTYGGGNSTGPTIGVARATDVPGTDPLAVPGGTQLAVPGG